MNTLFAKLSIALLIIVGGMGTAFFFIDRVNTRAYYEELSQNLNAPIAMYVTEQRQLIEGGTPDLDSLRDLAGHAMVINPSAEIYLLDLPSRQLQRLTWSPEDDAQPMWTPDGRHLLFVRSRRGRARVFTMAANGSHLRALRSNAAPRGEPAAERDATLSPDGRFVALVEQRRGSALVQVVRTSDGGEVGHSGDGRSVDQQPAWSPDGRQVVFVSNRTGNDELFVMTRDGGCVRQLTHSPAADWLPLWARSGGRA